MSDSEMISRKRSSSRDCTTGSESSSDADLLHKNGSALGVKSRPNMSSLDTSPNKRSKSQTVSHPSSPCAQEAANPPANWRDIIQRAGRSEPATKSVSETDLVNAMSAMLESCTVGMTSTSLVNNDLQRSLTEQLGSWEEMACLLDVFMRPTVRFCRHFFESEFCRQTSCWKPEFAVKLAKQRVHAVFAPIFSTCFDSKTNTMTVNINGHPYEVNLQRPILKDQPDKVPGLSGMHSNDRYYAYIHKVTESDLGLISLFGLLKLCDLSLVNKSSLDADVITACYDLFKRLSVAIYHAVFDRFGRDRCADKMRELCILFEWSKTFDLAVTSLFDSMAAEENSEPLFNELYPK